MTIQDLGAIGELVGGIAVIITLIYLALQIRQNTSSIEGATEQSIMNHEMAMYTLIAEHPSVYRRGSQCLSDLDADEAVVFEHLMGATMTQIYSAYAQYRRKLLPESVWQTYLLEWADYSTLPGFQQVWKSLEKYYPLEFRQALDQSLENRTK
jgi:hypothetical protein